MLTPDSVYYVNDVKVNAKIIPDGTVWKNGEKAAAAGFRKGSNYKKGQKLTDKTGHPTSITIHNTSDLTGVNDDAEQYTRATFNENMGSARVHFYVDENGAWQNLKAGTGMCPEDPDGSAEVGWHAGDGSNPTGGNYTSLAIEIIMNDTKAHDEISYDNGARLTAWLLKKHGLTPENIVSHTYWVNRLAGITFNNPDEQSTNLLRGKKWCPTFIFGSTTKAIALRNWIAFKEKVRFYFEAEEEDIPIEIPSFSVGDVVMVKKGVTKFASGVTMAKWVRTAKLYVRKIESGGQILLVSTEPKKNVYTGRMNADDVYKV